MPFKSLQECIALKVKMFVLYAAMELEQDEWNNIKDDCGWLTDYEKSEIEDYLKSVNE